MKFTAALCAGILLFTLAMSVLPVNGESAVYDSMIRLHVIANSDDSEDQRIKLLVRDTVVAHMTNAFEGTNSKDAAHNILKERLADIEAAANTVLVESHANYAASAEIGYETYPTRYYEDIELPAGKYMSLRIVLGSGAGKNWWCVLFPPLCLSGAIQEKAMSEEDEMQIFIEAGLSPEQYRIIKNEKKPAYKIKFKILELLAVVFYP
jgi:Stage II sporulation protein R (spore_II_R).